MHISQVWHLFLCFHRSSVVRCCAESAKPSTLKLQPSTFIPHCPRCSVYAVSSHRLRCAEYYLKTMEKTLEKGNDYLDAEYGRLEKMKRAKLAAGKKKDFLRKLNILASFQA